MKILLVPVAGLCNRINAITSAILYKERHPECDVRIKWWKTHDCCANFDDLFDSSFIPLKIERMRSLVKDRPATLRNLYIPRYLRSFFYDFEMTSKYNCSDFDKLILGKDKIYVATSNNFCNLLMDKSLAKVFVPSKEIQCRINDITKDWNNDVIGLHIRRTDNINAIKQSPISRFCSLIDKEILENEKVRFYLATDDLNTKEELLKKYGKRIITMDLDLKRSSTQGMKDAVVDLFCLGSTQKIFGSYHSTYSIIASQLYNIPLII